MKVRKLLLGFGAALLLFCGMAAAAEEILYVGATQTNSVLAEAQLAGEMELLKDVDGGVYALKVRLQNLSNTNDVLLRVLEDRDSWVIVQVGGNVKGESTLLTKRLPELKGYECHVVEIPLQRGATIEWFIRLNQRIENMSALPESCLVTLATTFSFHYSVEDFARPMTRDLRRGVIRLTHPKVLLTRKALEGDPTEKYERMLKSDVPARK